MQTKINVACWYCPCIFLLLFVIIILIKVHPAIILPVIITYLTPSSNSLQSPRSLNYFCIDNNPQSLIPIDWSYSQTIVTNIPLKIFIIISHHTCNPHDTHHPNHHHIDWYAVHNQQSRSFVMHFEDGTTKSTQVNRHPSHHHDQYWWR